MFLKQIQTYAVIHMQNQVLRKLVKLHSFQNVNQFLIVSTFSGTFWCQLVLIMINRLTVLKHRHLADAFFLASIQDNSSGS